MRSSPPGDPPPAEVEDDPATAPATLPTVPPTPPEQTPPPTIDAPTEQEQVAAPPEEETPVPTDPPTPTEEASPTEVPTPTETVWVNADSLAVITPASGTPMTPGGQQQIAIRYQVTTPRIATTIYAELAGDVTGWTLSSPALGNAGGTATSATWVEQTTLDPGSSFDLPIVISAPADVTAIQTVELHLWSTASTTMGNEPGVASPGIANADFSVAPPEPQATDAPAVPSDNPENPASEPDAATPEAMVPEVNPPTIACQSGETANTFACAIDPGRSNATAASLILARPEGWDFAVNGMAPDASGNIDLATAGIDISAPTNVTLTATPPAGCSDQASEPGLKVTLTYTYGDETASAGTDLALTAPAPEDVAPTVSMAAVDFGTIVWDGTSWGTAAANGTITIARDGCGELGAYAIQLEVLGSEPGLQPAIAAITTTGDGIESGTASGNPNEGPVTVAQVTSGFHGTGQADISLTLTPEGEIPTGPHAMQIRISTTRAP
ncbi:MAG TPA: hypothetical protein VNZ58_05330 [Thermomicrobiales bacterium]|nr:hypothetical protein [Thermomicrobiales bacterium]